MKMVHVYYSEIDSGTGPLLLSATDRGLCHVQFGSFKENEHDLRGWLKRHLGNAELQRAKGYPLLDEAALQLHHYFASKSRRFDLPLDLYGTDFQKKVWNALLRIEYGETKSYKEVAEAIDHPRAVRAVGMANNRNPISIIIPCHRVIGHDGSLVGYGGGLDIKKSLLALEKEKVKGEICFH